MSKHIPAPISEGSPYMPVITYTMACPMVMIIPNTAKRQKKNDLQLEILQGELQLVLLNSAVCLPSSKQIENIHGFKGL